MKKINALSMLFYALLALPVLSSQAFAYGSWWGVAQIDGVNATAGTPVTAYSVLATTGATSGVSLSTVNTSVGQYKAGYYLIDINGNSGTDNVTFRVCGVTVREAPQSYSDGDHYLTLTMNKTADGAACTYACGCSGGYCNSGTCASSAPSTGGTTTTTSGGSGTSAGGGAAEVSETRTITSIAPGASGTVAIVDSATLKVQEVTVYTKGTATTATNVAITVKESSAPTSAPTVIASDKGAVYKYLDISKTSVADADVSKVKIKFKVEKTWVTTNSIDASKVALNRYSSGAWTKYAATKLSDDATYYYYEAEVPGLSVFAITGEKVAAAITPTTTPTTQPTTQPTTAPITQPTTPTTPTIPTTIPVIGGLPLWIVILTVVIIVIAAIVITNKKIRKSLPLFGQ